VRPEREVLRECGEDQRKQFSEIKTFREKAFGGEETLRKKTQGEKIFATPQIIRS
jgi:hypothetical protein